MGVFSSSALSLNLRPLTFGRGPKCHVDSVGIVRDHIPSFPTKSQQDMVRRPTP